MKLRLKRSILIGLIACLLIFSGCGKKNIVNSNNNNNRSSSSALVQSLQIACMNGNYRLANDANFYISGGNFSGTTVGGNWQPGSLNSGSLSNSYVGVSAYRDVMILTKVVNGSQVIGYNLTLSFCSVPMQSSYNPYQGNNSALPFLVSNDRALVNFQAPSGITINTAVSCGYGLIAAALNTIIVSQRSMTNPYTSDFPIYTSFMPPNCNSH